MNPMHSINAYLQKQCTNFEGIPSIKTGFVYNKNLKIFIKKLEDRLGVTLTSSSSGFKRKF